MTRVDIMVDIETLGTKSDSTIFQIAAMAFDINNGVIIKEFNMIADIEKNERPLQVTGSTLKWWLKTDKNLLFDLLHAGDRSSEAILNHFYHWIKGFGISPDDMSNVYLWGNGILFDNKMIQHQFELLGLDYPIHYKNDRDMRTLLELASLKEQVSEKVLKDRFTNLSLRHHNAYDDVRYQINVVTCCYKIVTEDSMPF